MNEVITIDILQQKIFTIRNKRVMVDRDLAELYGIETKKLNQSVKRNIKRFPADFMFQLTNEEQNELVTNCDRLRSMKHSSSNAYVFTEHGVTMLASVLNSDKAIEIIEHSKDYKEDMKEIHQAIDLLMDRTKPVKVGFIKTED